MKTTITFCILALMFISNQTFAQSKSGTAQEDSLTKLLCKKWEVDYLLLGNTKISVLPNAEEVNYEFNKNRTLLMSGRDSRGRTKGNWCYDKKTKSIRLTIKGKSNTSIERINEKELVLLAETKNASEKNLPEIRLVYKLRQDENPVIASLASN